MFRYLYCISTFITIIDQFIYIRLFNCWISLYFSFEGIIHSDLKPANFVIVDASLKLIDFGIANRIQPDVTSIMKDSQVRTGLI